MKRFVTLVVGAAAMLAIAGSAFAFITYPNATCPDSVTIHQVVSPQGTCHPTPGAGAPGDTVMGIGAIITGFDLVPTSYAIYMQNNRSTDSTGYLAGIDVFTGALNWNSTPRNLAVGDSIVVEWACSEIFQGSNEVLSPNNNQSAPNIVIRKVSSGNTVPAFHLGTTTELRTNEATTTGIPYLCALVKINGPLFVARKNVTGTNNFYLVSPSSPGDSVYVNGFSLTTYGSPEVGTQVDFVQGIFEHRTSSHYAIWLRNGNDISVATPPNVNEAYPISDTQIRLTFDRDVTSGSATNTANYSLASIGLVSSAVMDGSQAVILTINNGLNHGDMETVTVNGITGLANGLSMTSPQSKSFVNGVLTVREVSAPNADSLLFDVPCTDRSRFAGVGGQVSQGLAGARMTTAGVCTGVYGALAYFEDENASATGDHGGVSAFGLPIPPTVGHKYLIAAEVQEFFGETELNFTTYQVDLGVAATMPAPIPVSVHTVSLDTCVVSNANGGSGYVPPSAVLSGEDFEGMLVRLMNVKRVVRRDAYITPPFGTTTGFHVAGPNGVFSDTMYVQNLNSVLGPLDSLNVNYPAEGTWITVTGLVHYDNGSFRVCPRNAADIQVFGPISGSTPTPKPLSFSVYPNPARRPVVSFSLPAAAHVELGVYDVTGRKVASLASGNMPAGSYSRGWLGRDSNGNPVAAGVYFYRLQAGSEVRTVRAIMLGN
jgi:hypothetical protein